MPSSKRKVQVPYRGVDRMLPLVCSRCTDQQFAARVRRCPIRTLRCGETAELRTHPHPSIFVSGPHFYEPVLVTGSVPLPHLPLLPAKQRRAIVDDTKKKIFLERHGNHT